MTLVAPAADTTAEEWAGVDAAMELWHAVGGPPISRQAGHHPVAGLQTLPIGFERAAPSFFGLYRPAQADILINRALIDPRARAITIAHEMGHAFGLAHVKGRRSLMNPGNLQVLPAAEDVRLINERRGPCPAP
jgi:hypothetical protein